MTKYLIHKCKTLTAKERMNMAWEFMLGTIGSLPGMDPEQAALSVAEAMDVDADALYARYLKETMRCD